jgi:hypothetical protein
MLGFLSALLLLLVIDAVILGVLEIFLNRRALVIFLNRRKYGILLTFSELLFVISVVFYIYLIADAKTAFMILALYSYQECRRFDKLSYYYYEQRRKQRRKRQEARLRSFFSERYRRLKKHLKTLEKVVKRFFS